MSKKARRSQRRTARAPSAQPATGEHPQAAVRPTFVPRVAAASKVNLAQEYQYVFADLRKIAVIAAVMFVVLFALNFVLR